MNTQRDAELDELFGTDPELLEVAQRLRSAPHPAAHIEPNPHFRMALRRRLMREAWERASRPPMPWYRRLVGPQQPLAWAGAAVGALLIVFFAFLFSTATPPAGPKIVDQNVRDGQLVATVQPLSFTFSQAMNQDSVNRAVTIEPPAQVSYSWSTDARTLTITPSHPLATNTHYEVTVGQSAQSQSGQRQAAAKAVSFVTTTQPPPSPTPAPPATNTHGLTIPIKLGALAGGAQGLLEWAGDGSKVYVIGPGGALVSYPAQGGTPTTIQPDGVSLLTVGPSGTLAYYRVPGAGATASSSATASSPGPAQVGTITAGAQSVSGVQPIALGFRLGSLVFATATDVQTADQHRLALLKEQASAAEFSPLGDKLAYLGASGLHLVDLATSPTGQDTLIGPATGLGDWSPDDHHLGYPTDVGLTVADATGGPGGPGVKAATLPGIKSVSWSRNNQILLSTGSELDLLTYGDTSGAVRLATGEFGQPKWSPVPAPTTGGLFAFSRGGQAWLDRVTGPAPQLVNAVAPALNQGDLVRGYLAARQSGANDQVQSYLDGAGKDAYSKLTAAWPDQTATQTGFNVLLTQTGRVVARLVNFKAGGATTFDETLTIVTGAGGQLAIHGIGDGQQVQYGTGPEVRSVLVTGSQVQVFFDSDLIPSTVSSGVSIKGAASQATYDGSQHMVTLTVASGLTSGTVYTLDVSPALEDTQGRSAVSHEIQLTGP
jgi:hypothetical protein